MAQIYNSLPLGYTQQWLNLGIVDQAKIQRDVTLFDSGGDPNPEHYRWRSFTEFLTKQNELDSDVAKALYRLGANDEDHSMGGAIMADILWHKHCPESLLIEALSSDRPHLCRIAEKRMVAK